MHESLYLMLKKNQDGNKQSQSEFKIKNIQRIPDTKNDFTVFDLDKI